MRLPGALAVKEGPLSESKEDQIRQALLKKSETLLRCVERAAADGTIDAMEAVLPELKSMMSVREFPSDRRREVDELSRGFQCSAYTRSVEALLSRAEHGAREGDAKSRNEHLTKAKDHFVKALRCGADEGFRAAVEKRVQACLMTSAPGVDQRTKDASARRLEARDQVGSTAKGRERRRAIRYGAPILNVELDGQVFETADWSQVGLLLDGYTGRPNLKVGDKVSVRLSCAGIESRGKQTARVVRVFRERRQLALEFPEISTNVLDLIAGIRRLGMVPRAR
jgi:hypothetical protein